MTDDQQYPESTADRLERVVARFDEERARRKAIHEGVTGKGRDQPVELFDITQGANRPPTR